MKPNVVITGVTGNMGWAGFQEIYKKKDRFRITLLARPSKKNFKKLSEYQYDPDVNIVWGDLTEYSDVLAAVNGADYVLHIGGMVSPAADYYPDKTLRVNVSSAENVVKAILAQPDPDKIKAVYIGSVAEYGNRMSPIHWGRAGDPMRASAYDQYSVSKCIAEKLFTDSGLKNWVILRQSGILYPGILKVLNPTAFHVPVQGMLEWATIEDSGRLLANIIEADVPEDFWNRIYNISSGQEYRMTNYEFETRLLKGLGLPGPEKVFEPQWFALQNFHGMWYTDADILEEYLHFRANTPVDEYFASMRSRLPWFYRLAFLAPAFAVKMFMKPYAYEKELGTQNWVENDPEKFAAYYGTRENYDAIKSWDDIRPPFFEKDLEKAEKNGDVICLDHGYDESRSIYDLSDEELKKAAAFRGGVFLGPVDSDSANKGKARRKGEIYRWRCEHGHEFTASLEFILLSGGWCLDCDISRLDLHTGPANRFVSQVLR